jgi:hypothetical protein
MVQMFAYDTSDRAESTARDQNELCIECRRQDVPSVHLVFITKYRRGVLSERAHRGLRDSFEQVCDDFGAVFSESDGGKYRIIPKKCRWVSASITKAAGAATATGGSSDR